MKKNLKIQKFYKLECSGCGAEIDESKYHNLCPKCGDVLVVDFDLEILKERLNRYDFRNTKISALKYLDFYPIVDFRNIVSLNEGGTPLYKLEKLGEKWKLRNLWVKNEGMNPTGVFKDRGSMVEVSKAAELGVKAIIVASSGNMAASCAAYAAKAGMKCYVLIPEKTPIGKLAQILSYGAEVIKIDGEYNDCIKYVNRIAKDHGLYLVGDYVFRREGQKSLAYEVFEQLGYKAPDVLICPAGAGTNLAGIWKGFVELKKLGLMQSLPKMVAVQASGAAPLAEAFKKHKKRYTAWEETNTLCSAVAVADPVDGNLALKAVYDSKGYVTAVDDKGALEYQKQLASREALFIEPSSALVLACIPELIKKNIIGKNDVIVAVATGNGMKDPLTPLENLPKPPVFKKDYKKISDYIKLKL